MSYPTRPSNPLMTWLRSLTFILVSRFLINLREAANPPAASGEMNTSRFLRSSNLNFRMPDLVGNMGESLNHGPMDEDDSDIMWADNSATNLDQVGGDIVDESFRSGPSGVDRTVAEELVTSDADAESDKYKVSCITS